VCKYRKKLLIGDINTLIKNTIYEIEAKSDFDIIEMESDIDHLHIMLQHIPRVSISSIVNRIKSITTNKVWNLYNNYLLKHFWKERTFWTDGYFVCSVGEANPETIRNYIANQG
jgi:putative transposase